MLGQEEQTGTANALPFFHFWQDGALGWPWQEITEECGAV